MNNEEFQATLLDQLQLLAEGQRSLALEQKEIRKDLTRLEAKMENDVINKVRALFDANQVQDDRYDHVLEKLSDMDDKLDYMLLKVAKHDVQLLAKKKIF